MYICLCKAVTDKQIQQAVSEGAKTMRDLRERFDIAITCGKCGYDARRVLREALLIQEVNAHIPQTIMPASALLSAAG